MSVVHVIPNWCEMISTDTTIWPQVVLSETHCSYGMIVPTRRNLIYRFSVMVNLEMKEIINNCFWMISSSLKENLIVDLGN